MVPAPHAFTRSWQALEPPPASDGEETFMAAGPDDPLVPATTAVAPPSDASHSGAVRNVRGQFFTALNLVSAGSVIIATPVLVIFFLLQKHFVAGLTLGANKG
jgi:hypothetical protein